MKKLLSLFCAVVLLAGCSSTDSEGGLFGGSECDSAEARDFIATAGDRVFFAFDSSAISSDAADSLKAQAKWLNKNKDVKVVVQGHADERGTRDYNMGLGNRRASAVKQYLVSRGVAADRISTISYGKEKPEVLGSNEAAWAQNRRSVTVIKVN